MIYFGRRNSILSEWLLRKIKLEPTSLLVCLGNVNEEGVIRGVVGYDLFNGASAVAHVAGEGNWITKEFLFKAFDYPFNACNLKVLFGIVPSGNKEALEFDKRLGFSELHVVPDAHPDGALHFLQMRKEQCPWLRMKYGRKVLSTST